MFFTMWSGTGIRVFLRDSSPAKAFLYARNSEISLHKNAILLYWKIVNKKFRKNLTTLIFPSEIFTLLEEQCVSGSNVLKCMASVSVTVTCYEKSSVSFKIVNVYRQARAL